MNRKILAATVVLVLLASVYALANQPNPSENDQPSVVTASASGGMVATNSGLMLVTTKTLVQIPGRTLEPGEYSFRLVNDADQVAVSKADGSEFYGTFFVIPTSRKAGLDDAQVSVEEAPNGGPNRIAAWFFPGETSGYALIYPHARKNAPAVAQASAK